MLGDTCHHIVGKEFLCDFKSDRYHRTWSVGATGKTF